jgi:hypothetical protein
MAHSSWFVHEANELWLDFCQAEQVCGEVCVRRDAGWTGKDHTVMFVGGRLCHVTPFQLLSSLPSAWIFRLSWILQCMHTIHLVQPNFSFLPWLSSHTGQLILISHSIQWTSPNLVSISFKILFQPLLFPGVDGYPPTWRPPGKVLLLVDAVCFPLWGS